MNANVSRAIEGIYQVFSDVPKPSIIEGCPCCIERKGTDVLLAKPLRTLTPDDLTNYASSAFLTVGSTADYLYFLPRILEILATDAGWWPDQAIVATAIVSAGFPDWPEAKRSAVVEYLNSIWETLLHEPKSGGALNSWLCFAGRLHVDLSPLLSQLAKNPGKLVEFYEVNGQSLIKGRLSNAFWDEAQEEHDRIVEWIRSPSIQRRITEAYGIC